jgi:ribosomal protein S18 acetylase RimI-like enzyme
VTATLTIGPLSTSHRARIEAIVRATGVFNDAEIGVAVELFDAACGLQPAARSSPHADSRETQSDYEFIGAFEGDTLVGYACFGLTPGTDRTYDLYWIAVHPEAQRSGAGAALMNEVERQLEQRHARLIVVETSSRADYDPTRGFYHKRGYEETARLRGFYAPGDDRVVLTKRIGAPSGAERPPSTTTGI